MINSNQTPAPSFKTNTKLESKEQPSNTITEINLIKDRILRLGKRKRISSITSTTSPKCVWIKLQHNVRPNAVAIADQSNQPAHARNSNPHLLHHPTCQSNHPPDQNQHQAPKNHQTSRTNFKLMLMRQPEKMASDHELVHDRQQEIQALPSPMWVMNVNTSICGRFMLPVMLGSCCRDVPADAKTLPEYGYRVADLQWVGNLVRRKGKVCGHRVHPKNLQRIVFDSGKVACFFARSCICCCSATST